ncbi:MAG: glycosyltransferase family 4 protein, partial [Actinobacteria bacterium]|nr:glycosyltransferase family 4 protein [Actinomycetota bacterium]
MAKKKVLVCSSSVPFVYGGAEMLVEGLIKAIDNAGYTTDLMSLPFAWDPPEKIVKNCLAWRMLGPADSPGDKPDLVIATKFPSYAVEYPNKVAWVLHQHRGAYDLKDTIYDDLGRYADGEEYRELVRDMDRRFLSECKSVFTISKLVSKRMREYCGIESEPIYHPPPYDGKYSCESYGDDILLVGRLEPLKRVDLVIKAMKYIEHPSARLRIIGQGFLERSLRQLAEEEDVSTRVSFEGFISDNELISAYANCGCAVYVPYQEDYGYSTLEA